MWIAVDLIILFIIVITTIIGLKKGLTGSLFGIISFVLSILIAFVLYIPVSNTLINNTKIDDRIHNIISTSLNQNTDKVVEDRTNQSNLPKVVNEYIRNQTNETKNDLAVTSAQYLTSMVMRILSGIIVFIIAKIVLIILKSFTKIFTNLPVIKQCDKLGGIAFGVIKGFLIIYLVMAVLSFVAPQGNLTINILESKLGASMYNNNLILLFFFK
ncbi:MAG: CvpA family protein [Clostridia bacterium]|nr:CvpA family protein [Clostridia bacterium]